MTISPDDRRGDPGFGQGRVRKRRFSLVRWGAHSRRSAPAKPRYARSAERIASTNPSARPGLKPSSHQSPTTCDGPARTVDLWLDAADHAVTEDDREDVVAEVPLLGRVEEIPHVIELEQRREERAVPHQRIERREKRDGRRRLRRRWQQVDLVPQDEALPSYALDLDGNELAVLDELLA